MRYRKNIMVFDTETTGNFTSPLIYDIAWAILDENLSVLVEREYLVHEIYTNKFLMDSAYYANKRERYNERLYNQELYILPLHTIFKQLEDDIRSYRVNTLAAYNIAFDYRALESTMNLCLHTQVNRWLKLSKKLKALCIWNLACDTIMQKQDFKNKAQENQWISDNGNIQTGAEVAYKYISNDPEFVEEHMSLSDVRIEVEILRCILENERGVVDYGLKSNSWQKVNKKGV